MEKTFQKKEKNMFKKKKKVVRYCLKCPIKVYNKVKLIGLQAVKKNDVVKS